ncbi:ester cyclase [uncultured Jatrophihabitans sp.]|uniref:ester cyclase n=1 Tax=uncultured Jatrophihabitans sp. TaxID=1610747 RepID=UPI0035CAA04D
MTVAERAAREIDTILRARDYERLREIVTDDFVDHSAPPGTFDGADGYVATMRFVGEQLGIAYEVADVVARGDDVVVHAIARGRHDIPLAGLPATGRSFEMRTMHWYRARGDRLAEHWGVLDQLGMLFQTGALPVAGTIDARPASAAQ